MSAHGRIFLPCLAILECELVEQESFFLDRPTCPGFKRNTSEKIVKLPFWDATGFSSI